MFAVLLAALAGILLAAVSLAAPNDVTADNVFGQPNFTSQGFGTSASALASPSGVAVDAAKNVYIADSANNRVLQYDDPLNTDFIADRVFGQFGSFTTNQCNRSGPISADTLCLPVDVAVDSAGNLFVVDFNNNRVLEYFTPTSTDTTADRVFGQNNNFTTGTYIGFWFNTSSTADSLANPISVAVSPGGQLYIGDRGFHRVLEYDPPLSNTTADRVFGQFGNFTTGLPNNGGVSADSLQDFNGIGVDIAGNLYVADTNNARVLKYNNPISTDTTADLVFGQFGNFTTNNPNSNGVNGDTLELPTDVDVDGADNVIITDTGTERTLIFDNPAALGTTADVVFGQGGNMTSFGNNNGGLSAVSQADPWAIDFDNLCNLYIVDYGNNRVLEYDKPPHACIDAPLPTPTPMPLPTAPVLEVGPGTSVAVSFNGGTSHARGGTITFAQVSSGGDLNVTTGQVGPPAPADHDVLGFHGHGAVDSSQPAAPVYYEISTTASISGVHSICMAYDQTQLAPGALPLLMHYGATGWTNITSTTDVTNSVICGSTASFSPFAIMQSNSSGPVGGLGEIMVSPSSSDPSWPLIAVLAGGLLVMLFAAAWLTARRIQARGG